MNVESVNRTPSNVGQRKHVATIYFFLSIISLLFILIIEPNYSQVLFDYSIGYIEALQARTEQHSIVAWQIYT